MRPVEVARKHGRFQIVHCCTRCGKRQPNKIAEGTRAPDDFDAILAVMGTPAR